MEILCTFGKLDRGKHHGKRFECILCYRKFTLKHNLARHFYKIHLKIPNSAKTTNDLSKIQTDTNVVDCLEMTSLQYISKKCNVEIDDINHQNTNTTSTPSLCNRSKYSSRAATNTWLKIDKIFADYKNANAKLLTKFGSTDKQIGTETNKSNKSSNKIKQSSIDKNSSRCCNTSKSKKPLNIPKLQPFNLVNSVESSHEHLLY